MTKIVTILKISQIANFRKSPSALWTPFVMSGNPGPTRRGFRIKTSIQPLVDASITDHRIQTGKTAGNFTHFLSDIKSAHYYSVQSLFQPVCKNWSPKQQYNLEILHLFLYSNITLIHRFLFKLNFHLTAFSGKFLIEKSKTT